LRAVAFDYAYVNELKNAVWSNQMSIYDVTPVSVADYRRRAQWH